MKDGRCICTLNPDNLLGIVASEPVVREINCLRQRFTAATNNQYPDNDNNVIGLLFILQ